MTLKQAIEILNREPLISENDDFTLVGFEQQTLHLNPADPANIIFLSKIIQDFDGTYNKPQPHHLVRNKHGNLSIWTFTPPL